MQIGVGCLAGTEYRLLRRCPPDPSWGPHDPTTAVDLAALVLIRDKSSLAPETPQCDDDGGQLSRRQDVLAGAASGRRAAVRVALIFIARTAPVAPACRVTPSASARIPSVKMITPLDPSARMPRRPRT
jgi:hypothetical protein